METKVWKLFFTQRKVCLNRTMQYGNFNTSLPKTNIYPGLNRTMQYGNAGATSWYDVRMSFKSYYVVWKPRDFRTLQYAHKEFKSYYVVWKPIKIVVTNSGDTV